MRGLKSFIGLLVVGVGLGAYLYFVESKRDPFESTETRDKVFTVESTNISEVTVRSESGEQTTLKKVEAGWQITAPVAAAADAGEISGITTNLSTLEEQRLIEENPADLAEFGLAQPRIEVAFKTGADEQRLLIGGKTPTGGDLYAKTAASPRVFLIPSYLESTFNRTTFDLRDKTALTFDRENADRVEVVTAGRTVRFAKVNGTWQLSEPSVPRADTAAIESLVSRLNSLQMKGVADADGQAKSGLDKPAATVRIGAGSAEATLLVGAPADEGNVYAKDASRDTVFTIESSLLDDLKKDPFEYQQKDVFDARSFNTTRIEIARGGETFVFERKDDKWHQTTPAQKEADGAKVDALLSALTNARADSFVDQPSSAPELTVLLSFEDGAKQERVTFYRSADSALAARDGVPGAGKLPLATLDAIVKAFEDAR